MSNVILRCSKVSQCSTIKDFYFLNGNGKENFDNFLPTTLLLLYAWFYAGFTAVLVRLDQRVQTRLVVITIIKTTTDN